MKMRSRNLSTVAIAAGCLLLLSLGALGIYGTYYFKSTVRNYHIASGAMAPTLLPGDRIYASRLPSPTPKKLEKLRRGQVVTYLADNGIVFVSRIVGLPGDKIEIDGRDLRVNGKSHLPSAFGSVPNPAVQKVAPDTEMGTEEHDGHAFSALWRRNYQNPTPVSLTVGTEEVFVLSDNRDNSGADSREKGPLRLHQIDSLPKLIWYSRESGWSFKPIE